MPGPHMVKVTKQLFPQEMKNKILAYMPTNGHLTNPEYTKYWQELAEKNHTKFIFIDNMLLEDSNEKAKIEQANILLITGGNTFELLHNLRQSKLDQAVIEFSKRNDCILAGFSAGAIVLSPTILAASQPTGDDPSDLVDENLVGITDLTGLKIIDFEVFPHYNPQKDKETLTKYRQISSNQVREITDREYIVINS